ncbi:MAG: UDP-N-acetylmuramoyl-L-alanyl-D-glutamate--2,6-diaminopimelate ligase, partial [Pseudomonadota bacterium]
TLAALGLAAPPGVPAEAEVRGLAEDSREVREGVVFFAVKGARFDGAEFAPFALRQRALAVVCSSDGAETVRRIWAEEGREVPPQGLPLIVVDEPRAALAKAAAARCGPGPEVVAMVTGTNGKTSVASFLRQIWTALGRRAVNVGTLGVEGAVEAPGALTTPDPLTLHGLLADLAEAGATHAALEASSHGLDQHRLDGLVPAAAAFTNLSRDHLDYHGTMEAYLEAKLALFSRLLPEGAPAVVNLDDARADQVVAAVHARGQRLIGVGEAEGADLRRLSARYDGEGQVLALSWRVGPAREVRLDLVGGFQGENVVCAAALAIACGEDAEALLEALSGLKGVRGRMEPAARRANGARVYVDYSHTPGGLETAIAALRLHTPGRLIALVGAGGDRDPGKREMMGRAGAEADVLVVTDDNPRSEDPAAIRAAVMAGAAGMDPKAEEIGDRAEAILVAIDKLGPQDRLLIAGKGHETGQIVGDQTLPFDDAEQARAAVAALDGEEEG